MIQTGDLMCSSSPKEMQDQKLAQFELETVIAAKNGEARIDWNNGGQRKWFPYFWVEKDAAKPTGFGLSFASYGLRIVRVRLSVRAFYLSMKVM